MGLYVKGMKMPDSCATCNIPCGILDMDKLLFGFDGTRPDNCPLVEIPEPHGRLIDEGEYEKNMREWHCKKCKKEKHDYNGVVCRACWVDDAIDSVSMTATVMEAEGE